MAQQTYTTHGLYYLAVQADESFHASVERQFGKARAGDMRYRSDLHDAVTRERAEDFHKAVNAYLDACGKSNDNGNGGSIASCRCR